MATHMSHSGMDMYTQASWEAENSCLAVQKVQRMLQPMDSLMKPHPLTFRSTDVLHHCSERKGLAQRTYLIRSADVSIIIQAAAGSGFE